MDIRKRRHVPLRILRRRSWLSAASVRGVGPRALANAPAAARLARRERWAATPRSRAPHLVRRVGLEGRRGVPVLLLHGGFGNSNYFGHLIPVLVAHGYRVIAMDSRGHGRSTRSDAPLTYHLMAQDVIGLLDRAEEFRRSIWSAGATGESSGSISP